MAYLHCHSCDWAQDDFWSWRYNPITKIWDDVKWLWKPRWMGLDRWVIDEIRKYTGIPVVVRESIVFERGGLRPEMAHTEWQVHSWLWLIVEVVKELKVCREQKWWTWGSWKRHKTTAVCPGCGDRNFDID